MNTETVDVERTSVSEPQAPKSKTKRAASKKTKPATKKPDHSKKVARKSKGDGSNKSQK